MLRTAAFIISVIFHPLLLLCYMLLILMFLNPYEFASVENDLLLLMVFLTSFALPAFSIFIMKQLNMVASFQLKTREDRIGPYIISGILYLTLYLHLRRSGGFPDFFEATTFGVIFCLFIGFFVNNFIKISLHALGMGGLTAFTIYAVEKFSYASIVRGNIPLFGSIEVSPILLLYLVILIAGLVCTSRLLLKAHNPSDIYTGFILGFLCFVITFMLFL